MVYGRLIYNNVKEYTPRWMKTVPYSQTVKPVFGNNNPFLTQIYLLGKQAQVVSRFNNDPKVKKMWMFMRRNVANYPWLWQCWIFFSKLAIFIFFLQMHGCYLTLFTILGSGFIKLITNMQTNSHSLITIQRTLDYAIQKEKEHQATLPQDEE